MPWTAPRWPTAMSDDLATFLMFHDLGDDSPALLPARPLPDLIGTVGDEVLDVLAACDSTKPDCGPRGHDAGPRPPRRPRRFDRRVQAGRLVRLAISSITLMMSEILRRRSLDAAIPLTDWATTRRRVGHLARPGANSSACPTLTTFFFTVAEISSSRPRSPPGSRPAPRCVSTGRSYREMSAEAPATSPVEATIAWIVSCSRADGGLEGII